MADLLRPERLQIMLSADELRAVRLAIQAPNAEQSLSHQGATETRIGKRGN
jgi:hypothetical protein